jgi:hypothetical protein
MSLFARKAFDVIWYDHIIRYASSEYLASIRERMATAPANVSTTGSSRHFLSDRDLWLLKVIAEFVAAAPEVDANEWVRINTSSDYARVATVFSEGIALVRARTTIWKKRLDTGSDVALADLDRGFWRYYKDNRYAGYTDDQKPVVCVRKLDVSGKSHRYERSYLITSDRVPIVVTSGWDISHGRRLVHFFNAMDRTRGAIKERLSKNIDHDVPPDLGKLFAANFVHTVWNQDKAYPLFANYFDGSRGWYRVNYAPTKDTCREGVPPYGLSDSFSTGGYAFWTAYEPILGVLGMRLLQLMESDVAEDVAFIAHRYPVHSKSAPAPARSLRLFAFLPSLVLVNTQR